MDNFWAAFFTALAGFFVWLIRAEYIRARQRKSTTRAILSEISRLIGIIIGHIDWWEKRMEENKKINLPLIEFSTEIFDDLKKDIPYLDLDLIQDVVEFYGYLKFINSYQKTKKEHLELRTLEQFNESYLGLIKTFKRKYGQPRFSGHFDRWGVKFESLQEKSETPN